MLARVHAEGLAAAFERFGMKTAGVTDVLKDVGTNVMHTFTGDPAVRKSLLQGTAFNRGAPLHWKNVIWPSNGGHISNWVGRLGTILPAYGALQALEGKGGDPNEGRLTNALSSLGQAAGFAYGMPAVGMLGAPLAANLGSQIGRGVGRALGSHPQHAPPPEAMPEQEMSGVPLYYRRSVRGDFHAPQE